MCRTLFDHFASFPTFIVFKEHRFVNAGTELAAFRRLADPRFIDDMGQSHLILVGPDTFLIFLLSNTIYHFI